MNLPVINTNNKRPILKEEYDNTNNKRPILNEISSNLKEENLKIPIISKDKIENNKE